MDQNLRVFVLDRPCDQWDDPQAQTLFKDMVSLKLEGFGKEYNYGVLPIDAHDFTSTHIIIGREHEGRIQPLTCCRVTTARRARMFNLPFPGLSLCAMAASPYHASGVQQVIDASEAEGRGIGYAGLWTIHPEARRDRPLAMRLRVLLSGLYHLLLEDYGVSEMVAGATLRFKLDKEFGSWGFEPLMLDGTELPEIRVAHLLGERVLLMRQQAPTDLVRQHMAEARPLWETRTVLAPRGKIDDTPLGDAPPPVSASSSGDDTEVRVSYHTPLLYAQERYGRLPPVPSERLPAYLKALLTILGADAEVSTREHQAFVHMLRLLGLPAKLERELREFDWRGADLGSLLSGLGDKHESRRMLYDAIRIASVDGLDEKENAQIKQAARILGISADETTRLVELVKQEQALQQLKTTLLHA